MWAFIKVAAFAVAYIFFSLLQPLSIFLLIFAVPMFGLAIIFSALSSPHPEKFNMLVGYASIVFACFVPFVVTKLMDRFVSKK